MPADIPDVLDLLEIRVLAVLAEKEAFTPDSYPLSLNSLVNGCNQLSSRDPVMALTDGDVQDVLDRLVQKKLVSEVSQAGARVPKYEHRLRLKWTLEQDKLAVLVTLMLRGVQTVAEIRARSERLYPFISVEQAETSLQFLIDKYPPLVAKLARAPGTKEPRHAHLLAGADSLAHIEAALACNATVRVENSGDRIARLEADVAALRQAVESITLEFVQFKKQFE